ncbi:OLC1v1019573C1 [Oldenlandia corymbosa var. corymbosa]|uniref:OLC1v1019573C1 n=1 Tax=Oldenlandia corymbosa var. corymbosa TaxID=529605 RepID=A0AAV1EEH7_OLDCO|nr:OLC1v1019573C1 [Oldenlandia corymbosa var. corymbosa]
MKKTVAVRATAAEKGASANSGSNSNISRSKTMGTIFKPRPRSFCNQIYENNKKKDDSVIEEIGRKFGAAGGTLFRLDLDLQTDKNGINHWWDNLVDLDDHEKDPYFYDDNNTCPLSFGGGSGSGSASILGNDFSTSLTCPDPQDFLFKFVEGEEEVVVEQVGAASAAALDGSSSCSGLLSSDSDFWGLLLSTPTTY